MKLYAVVMAGGRGERFWPIGRHNAPTQVGDKTMLEETVLRLFPLIAPEHVIVIANSHFVEQERELLPIPPENVIGEPTDRNTAPCVALATALIRRKEPSGDGVMILLPADHVLRSAKVLQNILLQSAEMAGGGALVTLGITPSIASTGYGYIHCGEEIADGFYKVLAFKEKPDRQTAEQFFADGNFKWNSGIFVWQANAIYREFQQHCPELAEFIDHLQQADDFMTCLEVEFEHCSKISIDYAIIEKARNVIVGGASFYWNDIGSWNSLRSLFPLDADGNVRKGLTTAIDTITAC